MYPVEQVLGQKKLIGTHRLPIQLAVYATSTCYKPNEEPVLHKIEEHIRTCHPELPASSELDGGTIIGTINVKEITYQASKAKYPDMADVLSSDAVQTLEIVTCTMFPKGVDVLAIDGAAFQPRGSRWVPMDRVPDAVFDPIQTDELRPLIQYKPCPQQDNGRDCGFFMCLNAATYGTAFEDTQMAQQHDIRARVTADIINKKLKYSTSKLSIEQDVLLQVQEAWAGQSSHPDAKDLTCLRQPDVHDEDQRKLYTNNTCLNLFMELVIADTDTTYTQTHSHAH